MIVCILVFYNYLTKIYLKKQYQQINNANSTGKAYFSLISATIFSNSAKVVAL